MNDTLLMILIGLMSLTLLALAWAVIGLLIVAKRELPKLQRQVNEINGRVVQVLDELIPTLHGATQTLKEAERALHEAAETVENLHIVTDNLRHKLEVADAVGAKVRRLPEKTARALGRLMHHSLKLGGRLLNQQLEKRFQPKRNTIYDSTRGLGFLPQQDGEESTPPRELHIGAPTSAPNDFHTGGDTRATSENSAPQLAERIPNGEATTHKEG